MPEGMKHEIKSGKKEIKKDLRQLTAREAVRTKHFWMLWGMKLINVSAGIMMISVASPMAQELGGLSVAGAAAMVGIMGLLMVVVDLFGQPLLTMLVVQIFLSFSLLFN